MSEEIFGEGPFVYRLNENGGGPTLLHQVCTERGWKEHSGNQEEHWNLWWRTSGFPLSYYKQLSRSQFTNHIPKASSICRKDSLARHLKRMRKIYGAIYDFSPHCFNLPLEYTKLAAECTRSVRSANAARTDGSRVKDIEDDPVWICKPVAQSQGRGIFLFRKLSDLTYYSSSVVQKYIERPLLIGGYKFDLRLYVCVTSYHPLTVYLYREGLARFGTDKFSLTDLENPFRHLTNSSINKMGPRYADLKERIGSGCKWTLRQLRRYLAHAGLADWLAWQRVASLVVLTILTYAAHVPPTVNCFQFFGFDVLLDTELRPWLLEVNLSPALANDCPADEAVKRPMLHDLFDLLGLPVFNTGLQALYSVSAVDIDDDENLDENGNTPSSSGCKKRTLLSAAGRWRRHGRRRARPLTSVGLRHLGATSARSPGVTPAERRNTNTIWGNGRDWANTAPREEGGWTCIYPHGPDAPTNVREMVAQIQKYQKTAYEITKNFSAFEWSDQLQNALGLTSKIWLPYD